MSLSIGLWTVLAAKPTGRLDCRCVCGTIIVEVALAALDESSACRCCGHRPLATRQRNALRAEPAQQHPFDFGGGQS
jgi:hypothetical protein